MSLANKECHEITVEEKHSRVGLPGFGLVGVRGLSAVPVITTASDPSLALLRNFRMNFACILPAFDIWRVAGLQLQTWEIRALPCIGTLDHQTLGVSLKPGPVLYICVPHPGYVVSRELRTGHRMYSC